MSIYQLKLLIFIVFLLIMIKSLCLPFWCLTLFKVRFKAKNWIGIQAITLNNVEFNTRKRIKAEKNGDKDVVYCENIENLKNRIDVRLASDKNVYFKIGMKTKLFDNDLDMTHKSKVKLRLKKPAYVGMSILELSKVLICEFHYGYINNKCGNNSRLLFTDTDSLMVEIKTNWKCLWRIW